MTTERTIGVLSCFFQILKEKPITPESSQDTLQVRMI
jgi:hypothetical protein